MSGPQDQHEPPRSADAIRLRLLVGPYQAFAPLRIRADWFGGIDDGVRVAPMSVDWLPRDVGRQSHDDLAKQTDDARLEIAARAIREDASPNGRPLLLLPELSRQVIERTPPPPGRMPILQMLDRLLADVGQSVVEVRLASVDGLDDETERREALEAGLDEIIERLAQLEHAEILGSIEHIGPGHHAYWRAALNGLTWTGQDAAGRAAKLVALLTRDQLALAAGDPDGRQLLELAPPRRTVPQATVEARPVVHASPLTTRRIGFNGRKVAFVCEKLADRSGGAERVLIELANALSRRGYQVDVLSHELRGKPPFYPLEFGVVHTNLDPRRSASGLRERAARKVRAGIQRWGSAAFPLDRLAWRLRYAAFHSRLQEYIDSVRPDVVVPFMPPAITATALAESTHRPRLVGSMHNAPEQDFENPTRWDPGAYARRRRLELMDRMDAIAVLLPQYRNWYPTHLRQRTTVVPNPVESVDADLLSTAERTNTILTVGRLAETKRHDLSLRAFAALAAEFPEWQMKILGVGPLERELTTLRDELGLEGRAHMMGHTSTIEREYLSASILCHPARFEGFPLAVTESLASGLPVVGFADCSGVNSLVVDGVNGILVDPGNGSEGARVGALSDALRDLMADDTARTMLSKGGPVSMESYQPDRVVDMWESVLFPDPSERSSGQKRRRGLLSPDDSADSHPTGASVYLP